MSRRSTRSLKQSLNSPEQTLKNEPKVKKKKIEKVKEKDLSGSSSESDIEDYLLPANKIDLDSLVPQSNKNVSQPKSQEVADSIEKLNDESDSSNSPIKTENNAATPNDVQTSSFQSFHDYSKKLEEIKKQAEIYKSANAELDTKSEVQNLLQLGEIKAPEGSENLNQNHSDSDDEEEDWQEIENKAEDKTVVQKNLEITVDLFPDRKKKKPDDVFASIKRRLNRIRKENQILIHKVHLLCWIGHGNYVNSILNEQNMLSKGLALLPSKKSYPSGRVDLDYLEKILQWYKKTISITNGEYTLDDSLPDVLEKQIAKKAAYDKKMLVYIFIIILRALGIQARLVLSLQVEPLRPPNNELHFLGADKSKNNKKKTNNKDEDEDEDTPPKKKIKEDPKPSTSQKTSRSKTTAKPDVEKPAKARPQKREAIDKKIVTETPKKSRSVKNEAVDKKITKEENKESQIKPKTRKSEAANKNNDDAKKISSRKEKSDNKDDQKKTSKTSIKTEAKEKTSKDKSNKDEKKDNSRKSSRKSVVEKNDKAESDEKVSSKSAKTKKETATSDLKKTSTSSKKTSSKTESATSQEKKSAPRRSVRKVPQVDGVDDESSDEELNISKKRPRRSVKKPIKYVEGASDSEDAFEESPKKLKYDLDQYTSESSLDLSGAESSDEEEGSGSGSDIEEEEEEEEDDIPKFRKRPAGIFNKKNRPNLKGLKSFQRSKNKAGCSKNTPGSLASKLAKNHTISKQKNESCNSEEKKEPPIEHYAMDVKIDVMNLIKGQIAKSRDIERSKKVNAKKNSKKVASDESDYGAEEHVKKNYDSGDDFKPKNKVKKRIEWKKRKAISSDSDNDKSKKNDVKVNVKKGNDVWAEVFLENEEKWICIDVVFGKIHCVNELYNRASHPVSYILAWNNSNHLKDITRRYCNNFNTTTRKFRTETAWWDESLKPFLGPNDARNKEEDDELNRLQLEKPLPTTISEYKNHPLYALQRHLLKFEAIYPPDAPTLGYVRGEPVYSRDCVHTLASRDIWLKKAKTVKLGEQPYKIVKARPKYDRLSNKMITDQLLEVFGEWQLQDYDPPTAENGVVPRNAYGNVDLFQPSMLPKKTVHLRLPGLNKVAKKMNIDCVSAIVGFDFHGGWSHPVYDGFVVCEEFADTLVAAWDLEQEDLERKEQEKYEARVYGNWKKLIKGLILKQKLKAKYGFGEEKKSNNDDDENNSKTESAVESMPKKKGGKKK